MTDEQNYTEESKDKKTDNNRETEILDYIDNINTFQVPPVFLRDGLELLKVSNKSHKRIRFKLDTLDFKFTYKIPKGKSYSFLVDDIRSVLATSEAVHYREELNVSKEYEKQWLSITFYYQPKNRLKTLHVIADSTHDFKKLYSLLNGLKNLKDEVLQIFFTNLSDLDDHSRFAFSEKAGQSDRQLKDHLSLGDVFKLTKRLNINLSDQKVKSIFDDVSRENEQANSVLDYESFKQFVKILYQRKDIHLVWERVAKSKSHLSPDEVMTFLKNEQGEKVGTPILERLVKKFEIKPGGYWSESSFRNFLLSKFCNVLGDERESDYYERPLNEYFILSSHNTYLIGRQIAGESSVDGYIKALQRGCRCLEIDIWNNPNDTDGEPIVNHGHTFTTSISLTNVVKTIKNYAFISSPFPLILSLEIHCSPGAQRCVVNVFKRILGDALITEALPKKAGSLPSPKDLIYRILLKVKKTSKSYPETSDDFGKTFSTTSTTTGTSFSESNENNTGYLKFTPKLRKRSSRNVVSLLSDLGIYVQGIKFRNFSLPESKTFNHCFSLSENSFNSIVKDNTKCISLNKHNRRFLMRVYPSKFRLKSSNFLPINFWSHGVQMVATNWQTYDLGQQLNEALFEVPSSDGYVLKPLELRVSLLKSSLPLQTSERSVSFEIEIISAQQLSRPMNWEGDLNPYVSFELIGAKSIQWHQKSGRDHTAISSSNGFNPIWQQTFGGKILFDSSLLFLRLVVYNSASPRDIAEPKVIGISVTNFLSLKRGYRHFHLKDLSGELLLYTSLFVRVLMD